MNPDIKLEIAQSVLGKKVKLLDHYQGSDGTKYKFGIVNEVLSIEFDRPTQSHYASRLSLHLFDCDGKLYLAGKNNLEIPIPAYVDFHVTEIEFLTDNCYPLEEVQNQSKNYFDTLDSSNPVSKFAAHPDLTLEFLESTTAYKLSTEQRMIAKLSGIELASRKRELLTIRDLVQMWDNSHALGEFSIELRKVFNLD